MMAVLAADERWAEWLDGGGMISILISLATVASAPEGGRPAAAEWSEASAAAARCDASGYQSAVERVEDQALEAMKAANAAVAKAARTGDVGTAGDAEWARYKALMSEAERLRWQAAPQLSACASAAIAQAAPYPEQASAGPTQTKPARSEQPVARLSEASPSPEPRHFRVGFDYGWGKLGVKSRVETHVTPYAGVVQLSTGTFFSIGGALPPYNPEGIAWPSTLTFPKNSLTPEAPSGFSITGVSNAPSGPAHTIGRLATKALEDRNVLELTFAQHGFEAPGWRISGDVGVSYGATTQYLGRPISGSLTTGAPSFPPYFSNAKCLAWTPWANGTGCSYQYTANYPYSYSLVGIGPYEATQLTSVSISESYRKFTAGAAASKLLNVRTPLGVLGVAPGVEFAANWWEIRSTSNITQNSSSATLLSHGPGAQAEGSLELSGGVWRRWPVKWTLAGRLGVEVISPEYTGAVGSLRGGLEYDLPLGMSAVIGVAEERINYPYVGLDGYNTQIVGFHPAYTTRYDAKLQYDF